MYPEAKLLVFCDDPWKVIGMNAVVLNENITYVLVKQLEEYYIVAEQRLGEL
jgi:isoleucyl-tRNA synthetase